MTLSIMYKILQILYILSNRMIHGCKRRLSCSTNPGSSTKIIHLRTYRAVRVINVGRTN